MTTETKTYKDEHGFVWPEDDSFSGFVWLSFVEPGEGFLGVIITEGTGVIDATKKLWDLGINPGGEVLCLPLATSSVEKLDGRIHVYTDCLLGNEESLMLQHTFSEE